MDNVNNLLPQLNAYQPAIVALLILCLAILAQSFLAGVLGFAKGDEVPGEPLKGSHKDLSFRAIRTFGNSTENLSLFGLTLILAIVASSSATWVNILAGIHVALRLAYWLVYYKGAGQPGGGIRTVVFVLGWFANLLLGVVALIALL